jgi:HAD superfamily hydrolase (TIGR01490 family)
LAGTIAFFDFDGTITRRDTMLELALFHKGQAGYWAGMLAISPWLIALKAGITSATTAKEKLLSHFFGNMKLEDFNRLCYRFSKEKLPSLIRPDALQAIRKHQQLQHTVVVVSASAEQWIQYWCREQHLQFIATQLEVDTQQRITGKLSGPNCNGIEKVNRINAMFDPASFDEIYVYGDTSGDKPMLSLATHPFYRKFVQ